MPKERFNLDLLDRRLIRELDRNCRQPFAVLARTVRVPPETVRYRVQSLVDEGVIVAWYAVVDAGKLGCSVYKVLIKLHNVDEAKVAEIITFLREHSSINWIARLDGLYDLSFTIWVGEIGEVSRCVDAIKAKYHMCISRMVFAVNIEAEFFARDPVQHRSRKLEQTARYTTPTEAFRLDFIDIDILRVVASDPRRSSTSIGRTFGVSAETVSRRIRSLEHHKLVTGYRVVVDSNRVGQVNYYVLVFLKVVSAEQIQRFVDYCRVHPAVNYLIKALGEWDYELNLEVADVNEYRMFMMDLTREFADIIKDYYGLPVISLPKFMIMPPGAKPRNN